MAVLDQAGEALKRKYLGLPGYGWLAIVGVGGYLWLRHSGAGGATDTAGESGQATAPGTDNPAPIKGVRNVYYGIRRCPKGFHKVGHHCVRNRKAHRPVHRRRGAMVKEPVRVIR